MTKKLCNPEQRISQGDIFRDVDYLEHFTLKDGIIELSKVTFPNIFVLTQDCDLAQDFTLRSQTSNSDKRLISTLVAPLYNAEFVLAGTHLEDIGFTMRVFNGKSSTAITDLKNNSNPRYHYIDFGKESSLPPSIIDFKHYFSINTQYLESIKETHRITKVNFLYREDVSQRFSSFLSRIGLPD